MKIPNLASFVISKIPTQSSSSLESRSNGQGIASIEWLFPEEIQAIEHTISESRDWTEGARLLNEEVSNISAEEGGDPQDGKMMAVVPLGLKNRWRIWKILEHINEE